MGPALQRHRGVSHFYLENYKTENKEEDYNFANSFGQGIIDTYIDIISNAFKKRNSFSAYDIKQQLDYHTLYLFQVLSLDRGTTSGLLIHNQNDLGIMGSLPIHINRDLLESWAEKLAQVVREHYKKYPEALKMQASGNIIPKTVSN